MTFPLTIRGTLIQKMTDEDLEKFSRENKPYKIEKETDWTLMVHEPTSLSTGEQNNEIVFQLTAWNKEYRLGRCVDNNTGFRLNNGSIKSPDAAWISNERHALLLGHDKKRFPNLCPDFVVELKSGSDSSKALKSKMKMWIKAGCRLAWLIDPDKEIVYVYQGEDETTHRGFDQPISGEPVLPKFHFILSNLRLK